MLQITTQCLHTSVNFLTVPWCCKPNTMLCTHPKYFSQSNLKAIWHTKGKNIGQGPWCGSLSFCWLDKGAWLWGAIGPRITGCGWWWWQQQAPRQPGRFSWWFDRGRRGGLGCEYSACEIDVEQGLLINLWQTPNPMLTDLSCRKSCRRWPLFSKIQWLSSSCSGPKPWLHITFPTIWCHMMFLPDGIQPSTCSTLQLNTIQQSTPWLQLGNSTFANTSWYHQIGWLQENCEMFYRYFCFIPLIFTCASFFARFSKTPHSFSHKALQTLQWWSPQWITSIRSLLLHLTVLTSSPLLSVLLLWLVRRLWTDTIRRPITQMSTGSPWVRLSFFTVVIANTLLVLHPHHKLAYFEKQNWEDLWIQDAHEIVHHIFDDSYAPVANWSQKDNVRAPNSIVSHTSPPFDFIVDPFQPKNIFNDLPDLASMSSELDDELDRYLAADIEDTKDPLMWWYKHRGAFSNLSHMACDYLSIPGKSTNFSTCYKLFTLSSHYIRHWTGFQPRTACPFPYP